jgi:hypothetical protein
MVKLYLKPEVISLALISANAPVTDTYDNAKQIIHMATTSYILTSCCPHASPCCIPCSVNIKRAMLNPIVCELVLLVLLI